MKPHAESKHVHMRQGLHCDNCHHEEPVDRFHKGLIGTPCPKCGANMLTHQDYKKSKRVLLILSVLSTLTRVILWFNPKAKTGTMAVRVKDGDVISEFREKGAL